MVTASTAAIADPELFGRRARCELTARLRTIALSSLARMYRPEEGLFAFRVRRQRDGVRTEGRSPRYTAIALIGLATESPTCVASVLGSDTAHSVCGRLLSDSLRSVSVGDVALALWAATELEHPDAGCAEGRLARLAPELGPCTTVELSWTLTALCRRGGEGCTALRERVAQRLLGAFDPIAGTFPHVVGGRRRFADHVSCFADLVYPIQALAHHTRLTGSRASLVAASRCARLLCEAQGEAGQWWWHYDRRTGAVIERYPVYAVHQDAMAPMALCALRSAGGEDFSEPIGRGLQWLVSAPELGHASLIDDGAGLIWRKVARREPLKLARVLQSALSRAHRGLRAPGLDRALPPTRVDYEDRPYHLGWLLHSLHASGATAR